MKPGDMTAEERRGEIAEIISEGLLRLKSKKARKSRQERTYSLYSSGNQSVHASELKNGENTHDLQRTR